MPTIHKRKMRYQEKSVIEHRSDNSLFIFSHLKPESHRFSICHFFFFGYFTHLGKGTGVGRGMKTSYHIRVSISPGAIVSDILVGSYPSFRT